MSLPICFHNGTIVSGFSKMENSCVLLQDGKIEDVFSERRFQTRHFNADVRIIDVQGAFIAPGFIDTHIHGFAGYGTEDNSTEAMLQMSIELARYGVTSFNPTLYPSERDNMLKCIRAIVKAMGKEKGAKIMGLHLEGPFISSEKLGVQRPETVSPVDMTFMEELWAASKGHIVNMTVAPELKGMRKLALYCAKKNIVLQAGHTNALYEHMIEGMQAGIFHSTHLFNAMSQMHHRNPGAVGAVLIHPEMSCEIIADGIHVHPDLIRLLVRDKPLDKIVLVTDGLKPTEQYEGQLIANGEEVVHRDGCFHRKTDDVIAGSSLSMIRGVKKLTSFGLPVETAVKFATINPAEIMRYSKLGAITPGYEADITVFDKQFNVLATVIKGSLKKNLF
ncbi:N-acetylglucosamine-6-phosphate deacetylase [Treponema phagedenis]|uniref:N-acetylglucosamine-6-phosphate deacetylase n=1 Tax=Treponema phagedenis TaxID=162 RepID=A0A0B7H168_TREPH|nr:N-acetylglucosamine-6-phosphate deacetylase [Treponema phagedenis]QEJ94805.1 N-acetylglucosamine-6-phosphate deacetylase [Treponema phagedenis]QEJ98422.1 N-acetylglucosamine-6-phosphate deacetylase [Treponema phagedenis]QEK00709.1 N-acetylglucosamine-6-phosphate deacetylase [Treponema phagedenis]QEK03930.1 N-acetylglucosamine-6-phosphate deacetylase [Treponema phagedenis]QEK05718.1 N-acetylglucosamine-6-phosphate deacetylase [Treponema phagedenis]